MKHLESLYQATVNCLDELNIWPELNGYWVLVNAIMIFACDEMENPKLNEIYRLLEEDDGIGVSTKDHDCQRAIKFGIENTDGNTRREYGFTEFRKPSVKKFCLALAQKVKQQWKK